MEGVTWVKVQIFNQRVEQVGVMVTHSRMVASVPVVLGMKVLKNLDLPHILRLSS